MNESTFHNGTSSTSSLSELDIYSQLSPIFYLCFVVLDALLAFVITSGNFLLLVTIYRDPFRCLRTPTTFLIANLGVADFLVGAFLGFGRTVEMYFLYLGQQELPYLNTFQYLVGGLALFVAVCSFMAMSWDRFVAVTDHLNYKSRVTVKKVKFCIVGIWLNALFLAVLPAAGVRKVNFLFAYCYTHFFLPAIVLTATYIVIFRTLSKKLRNTAQQVSSGKSPIDPQRNIYHERRLVLAIFLVLIVFYTCFTPYFVKVHLWFFCEECEKNASFLTYHFISNDILSLSSLLDPAIYAWRLQRFRNTFLRVLGLRRNIVMAHSVFQTC
ncbi:adenosine receptor A1-like [Orbicella faveolata]|uniref:adenosine receptor A1-like n=1 Tax=Orbicella faveolata TaxID=48498 RepID=UPI0009E265AB|nr:adenosine receptor A1-like [Orbicella faveolata]